MRSGLWSGALLLGLWSVVGQASAETVKPVDFQREVLPILANHCFACHGPDAGSRQAGLRLDQRDELLRELESGATAVVPGDYGASEILVRATSDDPDAVMPPPSIGKQLSATQIDTLRKWVEQGAPYERHWGFVAPTRPAVPEAPGAANPIDAFVRDRLQREGLVSSERAAKETLLRRLSLDLIGLPPTIDELDAFLNDTSPDAFERQVERLLASPHYGERWGRMWLDATRYADSDGYEKDLKRSVWPYRDWVVRALNDDTPYDRFVKLQVAGDLIPGAGDDGQIATGFLRNSTINEEGGADPEQFRVEGNFERVDILSKSVLGLTVNCSQCHDHKYDPLSQREYYGLFAYLNDAEEKTIATYSPAERVQRRDVLDEVARLEAQLKVSKPSWERHFRNWVGGLAREAFPWEVVPVQNAADHAQRYLYNDDLSVTSWGYNPPNTTTDVAGVPPLKRVTAIRLEAIRDPLLPQEGPGRSPRGQFALTQMAVRVFPASGEPRDVKIASATADFGCKTQLIEPTWEDPTANRHRVAGPIEYAIDGDPVTAWGVDNGPAPERSNVDHEAVFVFAEPIELAEGDKLRFYLEHSHGGYLPDERMANTLGRFRLSVTDAADPVANPIPRSIRRLVGTPLEDWTPRQLAEAFSYWRTIQPDWLETNQRIDAAWARHPLGTTQLVLAPRPEHRPTHLLHRGEFLQKRDVVSKGVPGALHPLPSGAPLDRRGLADWLVARAAPTTARSIVNRVWQAYFGTGLVNTPDDFGTQGERPSHPELLDWLSVELMDRDWRLKDLHRLIVGSDTYQQSSRISAELLERDPQNRLLARGPRARLDGEVVRDVALAASGLLNREVGGPPVFPAAPAFLFLPPASFGQKVWPESIGAEAHRRGLYTFRWRSVPHPVLGVFDTPPGDATCVRRNRSNTPLQSLTTLNEPSFLECSRALAMDVVDAPRDDRAQIELAFRRCVGRVPTDAERGVLEQMLRDQEASFANDESRAWQLAAKDPSRPPMLPDGVTPARAAAWTALSRVLLSLDETITKE
ncbi:MAG: PSD1 and planctomycete cytochrome C domain-containing protein [Lacipirellulaceae bacterium]